jgi:hypothetical protein
MLGSQQHLCHLQHPLVVLLLLLVVFLDIVLP